MRTKKGFALVYFLLITSVVVIVISTLFTLSQRQLFTTRNGLDRTRALFAAEAGLSVAMAELERDASWVSGFNEEKLPSGQATYSLSFDGNNSLSCINNLSSSVAADSYHGPSTVPPHSALLVVTGRSGLVTRTIEALIVPGIGLSSNSGILASGHVTLGGDIAVEGREDTVEGTQLPVDIHSNSEDTTVTILQPALPSSASPSSLTVSGQVSTSSRFPGSISLNGTHTVGSVQTGAGTRRIPDINIEALFSDHSSSPPPNLTTVGGVATVSNDSLYSGSLVLQGDLILEDGAKLFVDGDCKVNGSVSGNGTLYVSGNTELYGDARVSPQENESLSLVSRGHVVMKGFSGQSYLENLALTDTEVAADLDNLKFALAGTQNYLTKSAEGSDFDAAKLLGESDVALDSFSALIAFHPAGNMRMDTGETDPSEVPLARQGRRATANRLRDRMSSAAPLSSEAFLYERLQLFADLFRDARYRRDVETQRDAPLIFNDFKDWDPINQGGYFDVHQSLAFKLIQDGAEPEADVYRRLRQAIAAIQELDFDRVGSANFKGFIYTEGALIIKDDLNVMGNVVVNGDPSHPPLELDGKLHSAGEVELSGHSRIVMIKTSVDDGVQNLQGSGSLDVKRWINR